MKLRNIGLSIVVLVLNCLAAQPSFAMNWSQINTNGFGDPNNQTMKVTFYNQQMYVATGKDSDDSDVAIPIKVFRYDGSIWEQINVDGFGDPNNRCGGIDMTLYQNRMYVGTKNSVSGTQIWTYDGSDWSEFYDENNANYPYCKLSVYRNKLYFASGFGDPPISRLRVMSYDGNSWSDTEFNDNNTNEKIDSMKVYEDKLYLSTYSQGNGSQIWRYDESSWELVSTGGLGDVNNYVAFTMSVQDNRLLVSTANQVTGGQVWAYDGQDWTQIISDGLGDPNNIAVLIGLFEGTLYAGTFNSASGGELWKLNNADWTRINTGADFNDATSMLAPANLNGRLSLFSVSSYGLGIWIHTPPLADAGEDQTVMENASVSLDGAASSTTLGDTYLWTQQSGIPVTLSDATSGAPSFIAPEVGTGGDTLVFGLTVTDNGGHQNSDQVTIHVNNLCAISTSTQGSGAIRLDPAGGPYVEGMSITFNAEPEAGHAFTRWEGDLSGTVNPMEITLSTSMTVTAVFSEQTNDPDGSADGDNSGAGGAGGGGGGGCFIRGLD